MHQSKILQTLVIGIVMVSGVGLAGPMLAPPVLIDSGVAFVRPGGEQQYPAAAFDGMNWLVVWQDKRGEDEAIWGARVSAAGVLLDSGNILIADDEDARYSPSVAFNGTCYLVVWQDSRNPSYDIYGARVSLAGMVLDPDGLPVCTHVNSQRSPAVAAAGDTFLVVWEDNRNTSSDWDIYGTRVTSAGTVLDPDGIPISTAARRQQDPEVAFNGTHYLVTWSDERDSVTAKDVYAARVTTQGTVLDIQGIAVCRRAENQEWPGVAADGTNWMVVWEDVRSGNDADIYGARVSGAGIVLDPDGIPVVTAESWQEGARVAYDGTNYFVTWEDYRESGGDYADVLAARVTPAGTVLDTGIVVCESPDDQCNAVVARGSSNLIVAWQDYRDDDDPDIFCNRLSPAGAVLDSSGRRICGELHAYEQREPAISFGGGNYLVVWRDDRQQEGLWSVLAARVSPTGAVLDPGVFPIAPSTPYSSLGTPCAVFGNSNHLVVWDQRTSGYYRIKAARVTAQGVVLDTLGIHTPLWGYDAHPPAAAFDGTNWLVVAAMKYPGQDWNIVCSRIGTDGVPLDSTPVLVSGAPRDQEWPAVAFGTTSCLAVWTDFRSNARYDIYGARIAPDGTILDTAGIPISTTAENHVAPAVTFDGTNWLVAWQDDRSGLNPAYYYARVSQSGAVLDTAGIPLGWQPDNYWDPLQMVFDGTNYFVVWQNRSYSHADLWGARISPQGTILDSFPVFAGSECQETPAVALGPGGQVMVVYSGYVDVLRGYPVEAMRIWAGIYPFCGVEEAPSAEPRTPNRGPTIVRGVLRTDCRRQEAGFRAELLDISGRKAMTLEPGANDVSLLAPGVYFVVQKGSRPHGLEIPSPKVVVTR